ncbi:hypothetical protein [Scytonema sp. NUACC26]|uniref:hypothetical protein n=1 Tax=Scytonema sp. NUACC26 TaxID=3140176 RepID=UPI0034DC072B
MFPKKHKPHSQAELCKQNNKWLNFLATQEQELKLAEELSDAQGSSIVGGSFRKTSGSSASGSSARG